MYTRALTAVLAAAAATTLPLVAAAAPAAANPQGTNIVITEVQSRTANVNPDIANAVEVYNPTPSTIDVSDWRVAFFDGANGIVATFLFPDQTDIPASGFVIVKDPNFTPAPMAPNVPVYDYTLVDGDDGLPDHGGVAVYDDQFIPSRIDGVATDADATWSLEGDPATQLNSQTDQFNASNQRDALAGDTDNNAVDFNRMRAGWGDLGLVDPDSP